MLETYLEIHHLLQTLDWYVLNLTIPFSKNLWINF